tara:strand:- start:555 stop:779 length:225 start_codon:yes stop_codon:yes gene_type:complete
MKLYKLKDTMAVPWFFILSYLQYNKYYKIVMWLLVIGGLLDLMISVTELGELEINLKSLTIFKNKVNNNIKRGY